MFLLKNNKSESSFTHHLDLVIQPFFALLSVFAGVMLLFIVCFLLSEAWPVFAGGGWKSFFSSDGWYPLEGSFGLLPMVWSSIAIMLGAAVLAVPLGILSAVFVLYYAPPKLASAYRLLLNLLAGIPSVVFGLWGLTQIVPLIAKWQPPGASLLAAILVLALMILPTVAITSIAAISAVPKSIITGTSALGMARKASILSIILPAARSGIGSGALLATARALGETMAVLMVAGNVVQNPSSLFNSVRALTSNIALEMAYASDHHRASLFASGLFLTALVVILAWLAAKCEAYKSYA